MCDGPDVRVPVGPDAARWTTVDGCRRVLAIARTVTSTARLLEALEVFRSDFRVQVVFAINDTSPFNDGVADLLRTVGARVMPWEQVGRARFDLTITASENVDFEPVEGPIVVLPHGVGFHKYVPDNRAEGRRLAGLVPPDLLRRKQVHLVVTHPAQAEQLDAECPGVGRHTALVSDPTYERMLASMRLRNHYRRALEVGDGQRLVVVTSTWRGQSLLGRWRELPSRLLAELPADEFTVAAILHPNIWYGHGPWQVRTWLGDALDAGLRLVPPEAGWPATLIAADWCVGDHGSVSFQAAAIGVPLVLASFGDEAAPGTPMAELGLAAPWLRRDAGLREQLEQVARHHDPERLHALATRAYVTGARSLRSLLYELMGIPEPAGPPRLLAWPAPHPERRPVSAFDVYTELAGSQVVVRRYPAAVRDVAAAPGAGVRHLAAYEDAWDIRVLESASVLVRRDVTPPPEADAWTARTLQRYPGASLTAAPVADGCLVRTRDGHTVRVATPQPDPMLSAAAVFACLHANRLTDGTMEVRTGERTVPLTISAAGPA